MVFTVHDTHLITVFLDYVIIIMLMQHCFMGSSSLETIGELPEDGSCSDRDALINDSSRNDAYGMKGPYLINNTPREKPTTKKDIDMNNNMGNSTNNVSQLQFDAENDFNNSKEAVNGIADGDSTSSRHTFTSSLRQDLTPSPSCSYGSEDSISDDDYGDFQIQTFPLDNITHGETTSSSLQSHSNVWSRHVVFDINGEQNVSSVMKSYTTPPTESGDKCVHIEVFHTPPIKPTTTQKKTLNSCRSPRQKARAHHNKESQMKQESEKTHKNILPLKSEQEQEKNDADMLEMKKEHKKILAKFSFDDNGVNESELENDNNIMEVCIHLSAVKQDVCVDGDKKEEQYTLSKTTNGSTKAKLFSTPEKSTPPSAHTFVTEEHELKPEESQVIASLPGSTCISEEAPSIKQDPSVYNETQSSNKYDSSSHSRTKTDSFQSVLHRLKSLVNADNYLPKCSHYSSHDRALKHAGYSLKELDAKLVTEAGAHKDEKKTKHKTTAVTPKSAWSSPNKKKGRRNIFGRKSSSDISRDEYERILDGRRGSYGVIVKGVNGKNKLKQAKDKSILEFKQNMKNAKRIAAYLSLVKQYPEQYQDLKQTAKVSIIV